MTNEDFPDQPGGLFDVTACEMRGVTRSSEGQRHRMYIRATLSLPHPIPTHSSARSPSLAFSPSLLVVYDHPSAPVIRWFQTTALTSRCGSFERCFLCNVGEGDKRLREQHLYKCVCVHQGILLPCLPFTGELWVQTVCCFSSVLVVCQLQLVRLRVLTLLQRVIRSDRVPAIPILCFTLTKKKFDHD